MTDINLREIAKTTRASHYRITNDGVELFRFNRNSKDYGWKVGTINGNNLEWRHWYQSEPPMNAERL